MDEDTAIINENTRKEKIKVFFANNIKKIIIIISTLVLILFGYFVFQEFEKKNKIKLADRYNFAKIEFISGDKNNKVKNELIDIVNEKDKAYSPLALYFLIDNNIISENKKINELFDTIINETSLEKEIKNLVIYKKALFNSDFESENNLIKILNPIINSDSVWKSHALHLMAEFFYFNAEKQKAKEFFNQIVNLETANPDIKQQAQKRLNRDLSE